MKRILVITLLLMLSLPVSAQQCHVVTGTEQVTLEDGSIGIREVRKYVPCEAQQPRKSFPYEEDALLANRLLKPRSKRTEYRRTIHDYPEFRNRPRVRNQLFRAPVRANFVPLQNPFFASGAMGGQGLSYLVGDRIGVFVVAQVVRTIATNNRRNRW
jgi:hypothetical protein